MSRSAAKQAILGALRETSHGASGGSLARACGLSDGTTGRAIRELLEEGVLVREGENRSSLYRLNPINPANLMGSDSANDPITTPSQPRQRPRQPDGVGRSNKDLDTIRPHHLEGGRGEADDASTSTTSSSESCSQSPPHHSATDPINPANLMGSLQALHSEVVSLRAQVVSLQAINAAASSLRAGESPAVAAALPPQVREEIERAVDFQLQEMDPEEIGSVAVLRSVIRRNLRYLVANGDRSDLDDILDEVEWRKVKGSRSQAVAPLVEAHERVVRARKALEWEVAQKRIPAEQAQGRIDALLAEALERFKLVEAAERAADRRFFKRQGRQA